MATNEGPLALAVDADNEILINEANLSLIEQDIAAKEERLQNLLLERRESTMQDIEELIGK